MPWPVDDRTVLARDVVKRLRQEFPDDVSPLKVRRSVRAAEALAHRQPLTQFAPDHPATDDIRSVADWLSEGAQCVTDEARAAS